MLFSRSISAATVHHLGDHPGIATEQRIRQMSERHMGVSPLGTKASIGPLGAEAFYSRSPFLCQVTSVSPVRGGEKTPNVNDLQLNFSTYTA